MNTGKPLALVVGLVCLLCALWVGTRARHSLDEQDRALGDAKSHLIAQADAIEDEIKQIRLASDERVRKSDVDARDAEAGVGRIREERMQTLKQHWVKRWVPGSFAVTTIESLDNKLGAYECKLHRATQVRDSATQLMEKRIATLESRRATLQRKLQMVDHDVTSGSASRLFSAFVAQLPFLAIEGNKTLQRDNSDLSDRDDRANANSPRRDRYRIPDLSVGAAPVRETSLFDALGVRSAADASLLTFNLGKDAQTTVLRWLNDKEEGRLVDLKVGCVTVTIDKSLGQSVWKKYHYFLAQTEGQCEIWPRSVFRDVFKQATLRNESKKKGAAPAAKAWSSSHVMGLAIDEAERCQTSPAGLMPFDFDENGEVIFVPSARSGNGRHDTKKSDSAARDAVVRRRRNEFADDVHQLESAGGDLKAWEADQYETALHELNDFPAGMGIYGAHVMSFEAGLKAGLVGAYCSVEQRPSGGIGFRPDPMHSEMSIHGSKAECGGKLGGSPQCYRVDKGGKPDCWRGSPAWNAQVEHQRIRFWGERYATLYGPSRLERYMPKQR